MSLQRQPVWNYGESGQRATGSDYLPTITSIVDNTGDVATPKSVTITGVNLTGCTGVTFGGTAATSVSVVSDTSVTCTTPAHTAGQVDVILTTAMGSVTAAGGFTFEAQAAVLSAPAELSVLALTTTSLRVSWGFTATAASFKLYQASTEGGVYSLIFSGITDDYKDVTGLSAATPYYFKVKATNATGDSSYSAVVGGTTKSSNGTTAGDLLSAILAKIKAVSGIADSNVYAGLIQGWESRSSADFPFVEVVILSGSGSENADQRNITCTYRYQVNLHCYVSSDDSKSGADMITLDATAAAIKAAIYGIQDDAIAGNLPCSGFELVLFDYQKELFYEYFYPKVNTAIMSFGFQVLTLDTGT